MAAAFRAMPAGIPTVRRWCSGLLPGDRPRRPGRQAGGVHPLLLVSGHRVGALRGVQGEEGGPWQGGAPAAAQRGAFCPPPAPAGCPHTCMHASGSLLARATASSSSSGHPLGSSLMSQSHARCPPRVPWDVSVNVNVNHGCMSSDSAPSLSTQSKPSLVLSRTRVDTACGYRRAGPRVHVYWHPISVGQSSHVQ